MYIPDLSGTPGIENILNLVMPTRAINSLQSRTQSQKNKSHMYKAKKRGTHFCQESYCKDNQ